MPKQKSKSSSGGKPAKQNAKRARKQETQSLTQAYSALNSKRANQRRLAIKLAERKLAKVQEKMKWHVVEEGNKEQAAEAKKMRQDQKSFKQDLALALVDDNKIEKAVPLLKELSATSVVCRDELLVVYVKESLIDEATLLLAQPRPQASTATKFCHLLIAYLQKHVFAERDGARSVDELFDDAMTWNPFLMLLLAFDPLLHGNTRIDPDFVVTLSRESESAHAPRSVQEAILFGSDAASYWRDAEGLQRYARERIRAHISSYTSNSNETCSKAAKIIGSLCVAPATSTVAAADPPPLLEEPIVAARRQLSVVFRKIHELIFSPDLEQEASDSYGDEIFAIDEGSLTVENLVSFYQKHDPSKALANRCRRLLCENTLEELLQGTYYRNNVLLNGPCSLPAAPTTCVKDYTRSIMTSLS